MGNKASTIVKLKAGGYLSPGKRDSCRNCAHVVIAPYCDSSGRGIVYICPVLKGYVAAGGICPNYIKDSNGRPEPSA